MELRIVPYQIPEKIEFNYEEIIREIEPVVNEKASIYYSDEDIPVAKKDRAKFNTFKKAINDERIRMKKEYMKPFEEFEAKVKDINALADKAVIAIDKQIKEYEDNQKREKLDKIKALWTQMAVPEGLTMEKVYEERMLNTSFSMKKVETCFELAIGKFNRDMATLAALPEFGFEAQQVYISTFDINKALAEGQRMAQIQRQKTEYEAEQARRKAEEEAKKVAEQVPAEVVTAEEIAQSRQEYIEAASVNGVHVPKAPEKQWVAFQALLATEQAMELKKFFDDRAIEFKAI
ncbi:MAG: DUF1351 domain-containing protein [Coprococcus sp.]